MAESVDYRTLPRSAEAHLRIRTMVLDGRLAQGQVVSEADLVRALGMSRTPVREALQRLAAEGFVTAVPTRGYLITEISEKDLMDLYIVRANLEGLAAELAAARTSRIHLAPLEDLYEAMEGAIDKGDNKALTKLNADFHSSLARASGNKHLEMLLENIRETFERFRPAAVADSRRRGHAHTEHGELISALRARDGARARQIASAHVERALEARRGITRARGKGQ